MFSGKVTHKKNSKNLRIRISKWLRGENKLLQNSFPRCLATGGIFQPLISSNIRMDFKLLAKPALVCVAEAMHYVFPKENLQYDHETKCICEQLRCVN